MLNVNEISKYLKGNVNGVFHVGVPQDLLQQTEKCQELETYKKLEIKNIIFFEHMTESYAKLYDMVSKNDNQELNIRTENIALGHRDNDNQTFLDKYVEENGIEKGSFNFINIDVQGYELEVFKGATETLSDIDFIYTKVNTVEVYENCAKMNELDEFLGDVYGFKRTWTKLTKGDTWGDALYIKEN
jgi:hypothetical protein